MVCLSAESFANINFVCRRNYVCHLWNGLRVQSKRRCSLCRQKKRIQFTKCSTASAFLCRHCSRNRERKVLHRTHNRSPTGTRWKMKLPFTSLSCSCLGGRGRGAAGRWSKVGLPHKGSRWQRSRFILCSSEPCCLCLALFLFAESQRAPACFNTRWSLSFQLVVCHRCHARRSCGNPQERCRSEPGRLKITKTLGTGNVIGDLLPPSWDESNLSNKLPWLERRTDRRQTCVEIGKLLSKRWTFSL